MENKTDLRTRIKAERKALNIDAISACIQSEILQLPEFRAAKNVMIYYPLRYEINLLGLLGESKNFYFPKVFEKDILVCPASEKFEKSCFNIPEPCSDPVNPEVLDLILVPALAVDKENYRLGYGGGFYDRFLPQCKNAKTIIPIHKSFVFDRLPREVFDIPVDLVVTD